MCVISSNTAITGTLMDANITSTSKEQPKDLTSGDDEHIPKIRKTYTITKQRERWTEQEHNKFIEALQLHGRAWRRIEEHVGTKTAVQIRSHAQKFFSKVVRESACNTKSFVKPIDIPPPRPKRKPKHPYPRKFGNTTSKILTELKLERSISPLQLLSDAETQSPTSGLTTNGSDTIVSSSSNITKHSMSLDSYTFCSSPTGLSSTEQENICKFCPSMTEEENGSPRSGFTSFTVKTEGKSDMEQEEEEEEDTLEDAPVASLKLFGRTVMVSETSKSTSQVAPKESQTLEGRSLNCIHTENLKEEPNSPPVYGQDAWNPWVCGFPPIAAYYWALQQQQFTAAQNSTAAATPLPWWPAYSGMSFPMIHIPTNPSPIQQTETSPDSSDKKEVEPAEEESKVDTSIQLKPTQGFMPYKRCSNEREPIQTEADEERDRQRVRLCL